MFTTRTSHRPFVMLAICLATQLDGANLAPAQDTVNLPTLGEIVRHDSAFDQLIAADAKIEVLAGGFGFSGSGFS